MKQPTPWKRSGASAPAAARLLDAARPPPPFDAAARQRVAARLGAATGAGGFGALAAPPTVPPKSVLGAGSKVAVAAIAAGVVALSLAFWPARPAPGPASPPAVAAAVVEAPPAPPVATAVETAAVPVRSVEDLPSAPPPVVTASAPKRVERANDGLERELQLVDGARAAIAGRPAEALRLLDEHARAYPAGQLALERDLLRVEALVSLGRHDEAALVARSLADRAPRSLQAQRAAKLLGDAP